MTWETARPADKTATALEATSTPGGQAGLNSIDILKGAPTTADNTRGTSALAHIPALELASSSHPLRTLPDGAPRISIGPGLREDPGTGHVYQKIGAGQCIDTSTGTVDYCD